MQLQVRGRMLSQQVLPPPSTEPVSLCPHERPCVPVSLCPCDPVSLCCPAAMGTASAPIPLSLVDAMALGTQLWPWGPSCAHVAVQPHPGWSQPPAALAAPDKVSSPSGEMTQTLPICSGKTCWAGEGRLGRAHGGLAAGAGGCLYPAPPRLPPAP